MTNIIIGVFNTFMKLLRIGKLPAFIAAAICLVLLSLPYKIRQVLALETIIEKHRSYIGLCAVIFVTYFGAVLFYEWASGRIRQRRISRAIIRKLRSLSNDEKKLLRIYIQKRSRTQYCSINDGTANGLKAKHILYRASVLSDGDFDFPYNIQDVAYDYLLNHPECLELDKNAQRATQPSPETW